MSDAIPTSILIVEDELFVAKDIRQFLRDLEYEVVGIAASGEDAIQQAHEKQPHLILMDIRLKGEMDGITAARKIRDELDAAIVYLTAQWDRETRLRAKTTGAYGYVLKPWVERELEIAVEMALSIHAKELEVKASEERMRLIFDNALDAVVMMDVKGKIIGWNPQAEKTFGWKKEEVLGQLVSETIIPHPYREEHERGLVHFLATGSGPIFHKRIEFSAIHRDGREFPVELAVSPLITHNGPSFSAFVRDITKRSQAQQWLERNEQKYRALVETTGTGYVIIDPEGTVHDANAEYVRLTGHLTFHDIKGHSVFEWTAKQDLDERKQRMKTCLEQGYVRNLELDYVDQEGRITPTEINSTVIENDEEPRILSLCRDISERREVQEALKRSNADLDAYAYAVSHDLRSPLRTIMWNIQFLERNYREQLDNKAKDYIEKVKTGARKMERLIEELYENSKIGQRKIERVDCEEVIRDVRDLKQEVQAKFTCDSLPTVYANRTDMYVLFQNLISNAIKFREESRPLEIHVGCRQRRGEWEFCIEDNGIGIAPEHQEQIFQIFQRLGEKDIDGTGIGLANCKKAVERRGGRIWVDSEVGQGSRFFFTFPIWDGQNGCEVS
ncbi:MAG: PAS domain S-box protein [Planctomycetaceae bacterium]|nr:PAS domain S-box protein [Planctomycetaceae bacterium]